MQLLNYLLLLVLTIIVLIVLLILIKDYPSINKNNLIKAFSKI